MKIDYGAATTSDLVFQHSPVNLLAKIVLFLRHRFADPRLPWQWDERAEQLPNGLFIFSQYEIPRDIEDASPALIATRGAVVHNHAVVVGNQGPEQPYLMRKGGKNYYSTGECDLRIECIAEAAGESAVLADVVQSAIHMTRDVLCEALTLRDISHVLCNPTRVYERDAEKWQTDVDFRVFFEERWFSIPIAPELRAISVLLDDTTLDVAPDPAPAPVENAAVPGLTLGLNGAPAEGVAVGAAVVEPTANIVDYGAATTSSLVFQHSPINLLSKIALFLRHRFADPRLPWQWSERPELLSNGLFISSEFEISKDVEDASPGLIVGRGSVLHNHADVVGDLGPEQPFLLRKGGKNYYSTGECDIRIECIAEARGESALLADVVQSAIHHTRDILCHHLTLRDISQVLCGPTEVYERDAGKWRTFVDFRLFFEERWFSIPIAPELRSISVLLDAEPGPSQGPTPVTPEPGAPNGDVLLSSAGRKIYVNDIRVYDVNFSDTTPAPPAGGINVLWQRDSSSPNNVSAYFPPGSIPNAQLEDMAEATVKGRALGVGTGPPTDLSRTQLTAQLELFTDALQGAVPASGGGTDNFLRADGTWALPPGTGGGGGGGRDYLFSLDGRVPPDGGAYLYVGDVVSVSAPFVLPTDSVLSGGSVRVNAPDANDYAVDFLVNGSTVETLPLPAGQLAAFADNFTHEASAGDTVSALIRRTTGSGWSMFTSTIVNLDLGGFTAGAPGGSFVTTLDFTAGAAIPAGAVVTLLSDGKVYLADATTGANRYHVVGVSDALYAPAQTASVHVVVGTEQAVLFASAPTAASNGARVYLSESAGRATLIPPSASGTVVVELGILMGANGATLLPTILWNPRIVALIS